MIPFDFWLNCNFYTHNSDDSATIFFHILRDHSDHGDTVVRDHIDGGGDKRTGCVYEDHRKSSHLTSLVHLLADDHASFLQHCVDHEYGPEPPF